ncbi:MAG: hypothetical protein ABIF01_02725, partial [Candidatus Micrarchaeota archaeon]
SKLGVKAGEKFMIIAEFDQKNAKGGTLSLYIENKYGARKRVTIVNYTTYTNADEKESVAALIGGVWQGGTISTNNLLLRIEGVQAWQETNETYVPGQCADDIECNPWELCNPITHSCYLKLGWCLSNSDCPAGYNCKLDPRTTDRQVCVPIVCGSNLDCPGSTCDIEMHLCRPIAPYCGADNYTCYQAPRKCGTAGLCAPWETCEAISGYCVTRIGRCSSDHDCPIGTVCELDPKKPKSHTCIETVCITDIDCPGTTCDAGKGLCRAVNP